MSDHTDRQVPIVDVKPTDDGGFTIQVTRYTKTDADVTSQEQFTVGHWYNDIDAETAAASVRGAIADAYWAGHTVAEYAAGVR
jgi:hypothetical protein